MCESEGRKKGYVFGYLCVCLWHVQCKVLYNIPWKLHDNGRDGHITLIVKLLLKHCECVPQAKIIHRYETLKIMTYDHGFALHLLQIHIRK